MGNIFSKINWVDVFVVILLARGTYAGSKIGFIWGFFRVFAISLVTILAIQNYNFLSEFISFYTPVPLRLAEFISFVFIITIGLLIFKLIRFILQKILKIEFAKLLEKPGSIIMGFIYSCVFTSLILVSLVFISVPYINRSITERSLLGKPFLGIAPQVYNTILDFYPDLNKVDTSNITNPGTTPELKK